MGHRDDDTRKAVQIVLQDPQSLDIQIVGGLVQYQHVRRAHQHPQEVEPPLFSAGKLTHRRVLHVSVKKELLAHVRRADIAVRRPDELCHVPHAVDDPRAAFVRQVVLLGEDADLHGLPCLDGSGQRRKFPRDGLYQGRFPAAVGADDPYPVIFQENIAEVMKQRLPVVARRHMVQFDGLPAEPG